MIDMILKNNYDIDLRFTFVHSISHSDGSRWRSQTTGGDRTGSEERAGSGSEARARSFGRD